MRSRTRGLWLTVHLLGRLAIVEAGIRTVPLPALCRRLGVTLVLEGPVAPPGGPPLQRSFEQRVRAAERLLRHWPAPATCLRRSLLLAVVLDDVRPVLRLGWRVAPPPAVAHAWLEIDGHSLDRDMSGIEALEGVTR